MIEHNKGLVAGVVAIAIVIIFGTWWILASEPLQDIDFERSTTTPAVVHATTTPESMVNTINRTGTDVRAIVASLPNATQFQSRFISSGVADSIKTTKGSQYTIFVPTNEAFSQLPKSTFSSYSKKDWKRLIQYHIISGRAVQVDTQIAGTIQSFSGDALNFSNDNNVPMVGSAIIVSQYKGSNGVVYLINEVLLPPKR